MPQGKSVREIARSNAVSTQILSYAVSNAISCDKTSVLEGESARVTVAITNNAETTLLNNLFSIEKPEGAGFIAGSVRINGIAQPSYNPISGFTLPDLARGETAVIEYDLKADSPMTKNTVDSFATLNYTVNDPARGNVNYSDNTDTVYIGIIPAPSITPPASDTVLRVYNRAENDYTGWRSLYDYNNCGSRCCRRSCCGLRINLCLRCCCCRRQSCCNNNPICSSLCRINGCR